MTVTVKVLISAKEAETVRTTQYVATNCRAIIDKFTVTNTSGVAAKISINLVKAGDGSVSANLIVWDKSLASGETYSFPELVGHTLDNGGLITTIATAAGLTMRASGREVT